MPKIKSPLARALPLFTLLVCASFVHADSNTGFPARGRLFAGMSDFKNETMSSILETEGLKKIESIPQFGLEITTPVLGPLEAGLRYHMKVAAALEKNSNPSTDYNAALGQQVYQLVARVGLLNTSIFRIDVFGAAGGANTEFNIKSAGTNGELKKSAADKKFLASFVSSYGASVSLGYKWIFLNVEAGYESNKVKDLARIGNISTSFQEIDFSNPYVAVGLVFDGITATRQ